MNLNFGTEGYIVRYLQTFLKDNYSRELVVTGKFNKQTHQALINYLNLANVESMFDVEEMILDKFPDLIRLFSLKENNDELVFTSKRIDKETSDFISLEIDNIESFLLSVGWELAEYRDYVNWNYDVNADDAIDDMDKQLVYNYLHVGGTLTPEQLDQADFDNDGVVTETDMKALNDYVNNDKLYIIVKSSGRKNYFPNKEMIPMINLFPGTFSYYRAFRSQYGATDFIHKDPSGEHKICVIACKPSTAYTITHGANKTETLLIGCYTGQRTDMTSMRLQNVTEQRIAMGETYVYTTTSDANFIVIQCDSDMGHLNNLKKMTKNVVLGDINMDGQIDQADKKILADYLYYPEGHKSRPILNNKQKIAADCNADGKIDEEDMQKLNQYLNGEIVTLGTQEYVYYIPQDLAESDRVARLLVIEGNATNEQIGTKVEDGIEQPITRSIYGINYLSFSESPWIVHDKFIPYLLGMNIHKYSRSEEITYVQDILKEMYPLTADEYINGHYSDKMRDLIKEYQMSKFYPKAGDFDGDGIISARDESIIREYLDGERELTDAQMATADINNDGQVNEVDYNIVHKYRQGLNDYINVYTIPFYLGWMDVQTEAMMLNEINENKTINETGWKYAERRRY